MKNLLRVSRSNKYYFASYMFAILLAIIPTLMNRGEVAYYLFSVTCVAVLLILMTNKIRDIKESLLVTMEEALKNINEIQHLFIVFNQTLLTFGKDNPNVVFPEPVVDALGQAVKSLDVTNGRSEKLTKALSELNEDDSLYFTSDQIKYAVSHYNSYVDSAKRLCDTMEEFNVKLTDVENPKSSNTDNLIIHLRAVIHTLRDPLGHL